MPTSDVADFVATPVSVLVRVTAAPGTTAPVASLTVPRTIPSPVWPMRGRTAAARNRREFLTDRKKAMLDIGRRTSLP
jgi:hypothetical protein